MRKALSVRTRSESETNEEHSYRLLLSYGPYRPHGPHYCRPTRGTRKHRDGYAGLRSLREGVDWSKHDFVLCGFPVVYGTYHPNVYEFVRNNCTELDRKPNAMFNVTVVARTPFKATVEGNRYMQKFLERSPWRPRDLKCFAGKIDYPHLNLFDKKCIQLIMKITNGPTDPSMCIDFTDWEDVKQYAKHVSELARQA